MRVAVVIASTGRKKVLEQWKTNLDRQTVKPEHFIYSVAQDSDLPEDINIYKPSTIIIGDKGSASQRNRGIDAVIDKCDIVAFFDDDYIPETCCIEKIGKFMQYFPNVVGATGILLRDGINSLGITYEEGIETVLAHEPTSDRDFRIEQDLIGLYGCNMIFRTDAIGSNRFDENLPLYSWLEDVDFAVRISKYGRVVSTNAFAGVHQGVKFGRGSGFMLGYSQIANPCYLIRKGTVSIKFGLNLMVRNFLANHLRSLSPEPWIDRFGRVRGNWMAIIDFFLRRLHPTNILRL